MDVFQLEGSVCAVEFVLGATASLQLINAFCREWRVCDTLKLSQLLANRQKVFLLLFEKEGAVIQTLVEIRLAKLFPLSDLFSLLRLQVIEVRLEPLDVNIN